MGPSTYFSQNQNTGNIILTLWNLAKPLHYQTLMYAIASNRLTVGTIDERLLCCDEFELNVAWIKDILILKL